MSCLMGTCVTTTEHQLHKKGAQEVANYIIAKDNTVQSSVKN